MRIVLQNFETGLYLGGDGNWTRNVETALAFLDSVAAAGHRICHRLFSTYVVARPEGSTAVEPLTIVEAAVPLGLGDTLFIRGEGAELTWDHGQELSRLDDSTWVWSTRHARHSITFKLLLNDRVWQQGDNCVLMARRKISLAPVF